MKHLEEKLQIECVKWFDYQYPQYRSLLFHIPNGGKRSPSEAARFKRMGVRAGVSDLFLSVPNRDFHGMFIEMKSEKGKVTESQDAFLMAVHVNGYYVAIVNDFDTFKSVIETYLKNI